MIPGASRAFGVYRGLSCKSHKSFLYSNRTLICCSASSEPHKLVFLGTPEVAAQVLKDLFAASEAANSSFQVQFLEDLRTLRPDLCVTAAYGNILPKAFLEIPKYGTINIHPSLLPKYRGAAPVQRALQDGCSETGVSVAFTVRAMDAGPIIAQETVKIDAEIQAPELLSRLFSKGTQLLLDSLPSVWSGEAASQAVPQDDVEAGHAAKLSKEEGALDFGRTADAVHNQVRAFAGWPGTTARFLLKGEAAAAKPQPEPFKITRTRVRGGQGTPRAARPEAFVEEQCLLVQCGEDGSGGCLEVLEIQPQGKKPMAVSAFLNGLNGRTVHLA